MLFVGYWNNIAFNAGFRFTNTTTRGARYGYGHTYPFSVGEDDCGWKLNSARLHCWACAVGDSELRGLGFCFYRLVRGHWAKGDAKFLLVWIFLGLVRVGRVGVGVVGGRADAVTLGLLVATGALHIHIHNPPSIRT